MSSRLVDKFMQIYATIDVNMLFGYKRGSLPRLNSVKRLFETTFRRWRSRLLHNLSLKVYQTMRHKLAEEITNQLICRLPFKDSSCRATHGFLAEL